MSRTASGNRLFLAFLAAGLFADLWSKAAVFRTLGYEGNSKGILPPVLSFKLQHNKGGVWGLLSGSAGSNEIFLILSLVAIAAIGVYLAQAAARGSRLPLPLAGILAGAVGNLSDRIRFGYVRDFISVKITGGPEGFSWPTFNVADALICAGCTVMALGLLRSPAEPAPADPAVEGPPPAPPGSAA